VKVIQFHLFFKCFLNWFLNFSEVISPLLIHDPDEIQFSSTTESTTTTTFSTTTPESSNTIINAVTIVVPIVVVVMVLIILVVLIKRYYKNLGNRLGRRWGNNESSIIEEENMTFDGTDSMEEKFGLISMIRNLFKKKPSPVYSQNLFQLFEEPEKRVPFIPKVVNKKFTYAQRIREWYGAKKNATVANSSAKTVFKETAETVPKTIDKPIVTESMSPEDLIKIDDDVNLNDSAILEVTADMHSTPTIRESTREKKPPNRLVYNSLGQPTDSRSEEKITEI
jgi:hypothetical protein